MDKKNIESAQWAICVVVLLLVAVMLLVLGWVQLMTYLGVPYGIWQPGGLIAFLLGGAYLVLEVMKRRRK